MSAGYQEVLIVAAGRTALVLEAKTRRRNYATSFGRGKRPKVDYKLGVMLPTGAMSVLGWYSEDEIRAADKEDAHG